MRSPRPRGHGAGPTIATELMPGGSLQDMVKRRGQLPVHEAVEHVLDVIEGLEAAQAAGIVRRDVKPSNCLLDRDGRVRIGDLGISKSLEATSKLTQTGSFLGTPSYASPEQIRGRAVDFRSDTYSVGATLYALLTGPRSVREQQRGRPGRPRRRREAAWTSWRA